MTDTKKLLQLRAHLKKKRPLFSRKDNNKKKRIEDDVWRKARGCDNKQRLKRKGHKKTPRMGFRGPAAVRDLHKSGLEQVMIQNPQQLHTLNNKTQGVLVAANTGDRKRALILEESKKLGLTVLNHDIVKRTEKIHTALKHRKEQRKAEEAKKVETVAPKKEKEAKHEAHHEKKEEHKDHKHEEASADEKKKHEAEEKNKVLHKQ